MLVDVNCARIREDLAYKNELRLRAQTDLLWLAALLGYDKVSEQYHREVAEHYVQKDPRKSIADQSPIKRRLHLDPRGTFKSTLNMTDTVQWMLCFEDIGILLLSASTPLTKGFVAEITTHFTLARGATPSPFQELFPEYCIAPSAVLVGSYTVPTRKTTRKEGTLMSSSIESSLSGWHYDVIKEDDIVDNRNSETPSGIAKVKKNRHINKKMLMPWGYRDTAGTRYDPFDAYGDDIAQTKADKIKVLVRPALKMNDGSRITPMRFPEPDECTLMFPELLSHEFLRDDYDADFAAFMTQYMNDAHGGKEIIFGEEALKAATLSEDIMPVLGDAVIAWRLACASKPGMKYAAAAVGRTDKGRAFILDAVRGIFSPTSVASRIVELAKKHHTHQVQIESTPGAQYLQRHIENAMLAANWEVQLTWTEYEEDDGARDLRLRSTEPVLSTKRLYFSADLPHLAEAYRQFGNFGMVEENDLVDVIARVVESMPASVALEDTDGYEQAWLEEMIARDRHDRLYGLGHGPLSHDDIPEPEPEEVYEPETGAYHGLTDIAPGLGV